MIEYHARWVVPIAAPPIRGGSILVDGRQIVAVSQPGAAAGRAARGRVTRIELGEVAVMPGLVNAHTHLELSWLRGRVPRVQSFPAWIRHVIRARREQASAGDSVPLGAIDGAIGDARRLGTILIGDISNTLATWNPLVARGMRAVIFKELIGFKAVDPGGMVAQARSEIDRLGSAAGQRASLAAHAPYSVSPELFRLIRNEIDRLPSRPASVHLAESEDEMEFLRTGQGAWRDLLVEVGAWNGEWTPPACGPVEYLARVGFLGPRLLVVHAVHLGKDELERLAHIGATLVTCPRGNLNTAAGIPPVGDFFRSGVRVAVGTDSLASVDDLDVFAELATLRRLAPDIPPSGLLEAATRNGAQALGFGDELGTIEPGKSAELLAVDVPAGVEDVEEYLVGGIAPGRIRWIDQ